MKIYKAVDAAGKVIYKNDESTFSSDFFELRIKECETLYKETGKSVHVWLAINYCPYAGKRLPIWIQNHLSEVSANILECTQNGKFGEALGIIGRDIQALDTINNTSKAALYVYHKMEKGSTKSEAINSAIKHFNMGKKSLEAALTTCKFKKPKVI